MKKFFSLVLALVMALSLTTIAWGADPVAKIGDTPYDTLEAALAVVSEDGIIELAAGTYTFPAGNKFVNRCTINCEDGVVFEGTSQLNIKGSTVVGAAFSNPSGTVVTQTINGIIKNCTFTGYNALRYCYAGATVEFYNCVFDGDLYGVHFDGGENDAYFENCTFSGFNAFGSALTNLTLDGCTFKDNGKSAYNGVNLWGDTVITDCTFVFDGGTEWVDMCGDNKTLIITNSVATDGTNETDLLDVVGDYGTGNTATVDGNLLGAVAEVNGTQYKVFADAVAAATDGDTIVLLDDCGGDISGMIITIDTNGNVYTGTLTAPAGYQVVYTAGKYMVVPKTSAAGTTTTLKNTDKYDIYEIDGTISVKIADDADLTKKVTDKVSVTAGGKTTVTYTATTYSDDANVYVEVDSSVATHKLVKGNTIVAYLVNLADVGYVPTTTETVANYVAAVKDAKCGEYSKTLYPDGVFMIDGVAYEAGVGNNWALYNGKFVNYGAKANAVAHTYTANTYNTADKSVATLKCPACKQVFTVLTANQVKTMTPASFAKVTATDGNSYFIAVAVASAGTTTDKVQSAETFDAGIAMYVGMSVMAAAGSAVVIGKKKD